MKINAKELCGNIERREFKIVALNANEDMRTISMAVSNEAEVKTRIGWDIGFETLVHEPNAVRLERLNMGAALLMNHDRDQQVGVVERAWLDDKTLRAEVRFGKSVFAEEIYQDVKDGIRKLVSIGFVRHSIEDISKKDEEFVRFRTTDWEGMEISIVSIPANYKVGVGRSYENTGTENVLHEGARAMAGEGVNLDIERKRVSEIFSLGERHALEKEAKEAVKLGKTVDEFKGECLEIVSKRSVENNRTISTQLNMGDKDKASYSFLKAINAITQRDWAKAGLEKEVSDALASRFGAIENGFYIPTDLMKRSAVNTQSTGGFIQKEYRPDEFIELLSERTVIKQLGSRILTGITGNLNIPRQTAGGEAKWVGEDEAADESNINVDQIELIPKTLSAWYDISHQMMIQSSVSMENFVKTELARVLAVKLDKSVLGVTSSKITGLLADENLKKLKYSISNKESGGKFGNFSYDNLVDLESMLPNVSQELNNLAFLCGNVGRRQLRKATATATANETVWKSSIINGGTKMSFTGTLLDYRAIANDIIGTKTINKKKLSPLVFGAWDEILIGEWGVMKITTDPYSRSKEGALRIVIHYSVDMAIKHLECFGVAFTENVDSPNVGNFKEAFGTDAPTA